MLQPEQVARMKRSEIRFSRTQNDSLGFRFRSVRAIANSCSMKFKNRNLRALAEMVIGDNNKFPYRSSSYITQFFEECDLELVHDGSTRWAWTADRLADLLNELQEAPNTLPPRLVHVLRVLMQKADAADHDPGRLCALAELNKPLSREGFEAFYGDDNLLYVRHIGTQTLSIAISPHRPFTPDEMRKRE
jgi:hypothetical protein